MFGAHAAVTSEATCAAQVVPCSPEGAVERSSRAQSDEGTRRRVAQEGPEKGARVPHIGHDKTGRNEHGYDRSRRQPFRSRVLVAIS